MKTIAVIMAGGRGERFWPRSRVKNPKQFLSMTDDGKSMIALTAERLAPLVDARDIFVVTNSAYRELVATHISGLEKNHILYEPCARNTAPAIGLAAVYAQKEFGDALMAVLPSDHVISDGPAWIANIRAALAIAEKGENLVTIGIVPTYPETGYGYLQYEGSRVIRFVEKPDAATAAGYLERGDFLWNSGQFFWKASAILKCFKELSPITYAHLQNIAAAIGTEKEQVTLEAEFPQCVSESIDHGIMEKAANVFTVPGSFGWDDVGSWLALERTKKRDGSGNVIEGNVLTHEVKNSIIQGGKKLIAAVGLEDCIVIDTDDALFICKKDKNQDVKKIISQLREHDMAEYL